MLTTTDSFSFNIFCLLPFGGRTLSLSLLEFGFSAFIKMLKTVNKIQLNLNYLIF